MLWNSQKKCNLLRTLQKEVFQKLQKQLTNSFLWICWTISKSYLTSNLLNTTSAPRGRINDCLETKTFKNKKAPSMTATTQFVIWKQFLKVATLTLSPHNVFCEYVALEDHFWHKWQNKMPNVCKLTKECQTVPNLCEFLLSVWFTDEALFDSKALTNGPSQD